jgi:DNA-binding NarL/FixJ family response regulator
MVIDQRIYALWGAVTVLLGEAVLIVDDDRMLRGLVADSLITNRAHVTITSASSLVSMCNALIETPSALILLNSRHQDFEDILNFCTENGHSPRMLVYGLSDECHRDIFSCARAGVSGYHLKSESLEDLLDFSRRILDGGSGFSPAVMSILLRRLSQSETSPTESDRVLTRREEEVVALVRQGLSNREIADRLHISVNTAKNHIHNVLAKLGLNSRMQILVAGKADMP